jgi:hypothetical protein
MPLILSSLTILFFVQQVLVFSVKCISNICILSQNQIATLVFKNITNGTYNYQINSLGTSIRIPLVFITKRHVILTHGMVHVISKRYVAWYQGF